MGFHRISLAISLVLASLNAASCAIKTTSVTVLFVLDSRPVSLEASIISVNTEWTTYQLACPSSSSPENDACRAQSYYPAEVYHQRGSVYGGTVKGGSLTTTWSCGLGHGSDDKIVSEYGHCFKMSTATAETRINSCYVYGHSVPVVITAGLDKLESMSSANGLATFTEYDETMNPDEINSAYTSGLSSAGCPATSTEAGDGATTTASRSESTSTTPTTGAAVTPGGATNTASGTAAPSSPQGNRSARIEGMAASSLGLGLLITSLLALSV